MSLVTPIETSGFCSMSRRISSAAIRTTFEGSQASAYSSRSPPSKMASSPNSSPGSMNARMACLPSSVSVQIFTRPEAKSSTPSAWSAGRSDFVLVNGNVVGSGTTHWAALLQGENTPGAGEATVEYDVPPDAWYLNTA